MSILDFMMLTIKKSCQVDIAELSIMTSGFQILILNFGAWINPGHHHLMLPVG